MNRIGDCHELLVGSRVSQFRRGFVVDVVEFPGVKLLVEVCNTCSRDCHVLCGAGATSEA
jgi:hypothetical protein